MNGFYSVSNPGNTTFKLNIIERVYSDIWVFTETHAKTNEKIEIPDFKVFQYDRKSNVVYRKGSGGVAIAIRNTILETHSIVSITEGIEGIFGIKLKHNFSDMTLGILGLYLPPDSYLYGKDPENFFNCASVMWQDFLDCDLVIGAGDLNARIRCDLDYIPDLDGNIPPRTNPDSQKNSHGDSFLSFLKENRALVLNGRVTPEYNNFTFVSTRGTSVPDHMFCPLSQLNFCKEMKVMLIKNLVNDFHLLPPKSVPDHSILSGTFVTSFYGADKLNEEGNKSDQEILILKNMTERRNLSKIDQSFFMDESIRNAIIATIERIESASKSQVEIDALWHEIKGLFITEMSNLPLIPIANGKKLKRSYRKSQPFWNEELENLWFAACQAEKIYVNFKPRNNNEQKTKSNLRHNFKNAQKEFDKNSEFIKGGIKTRI